MKLLVSNNSELLRHLATTPFRSLPVEVLVVTSGLEAIEVAARERPVLALLDAEMSDLSGYEASRAMKHASEACRVVLVVGTRVSARQMHLVAASGADEVLVAPGEPDQLYDVVAAQLNLPRRGARRYPVDLLVVGRDGRRPVAGRVTNLSADGARLVVHERIDEGADLLLEVRPEGEPPISVAARAVWTQPCQQGTALGVVFEEVAPDARNLARLTQWDIIQGADRTRVALRGDITEATQFDDVAPALAGRIDFDMSQVSYMNSIGVAAWIDFLEGLPIHGYEFHACSVAFVLQASLVDGVLGRGVVVSFFAPYACESCDQQEERLLQTEAVLGVGGHDPPVFACSRCDGVLVLRQFHERYLSFLQGMRVA